MGNALIWLAEQGVSIENNFSSAIECYEKAEKISEKENVPALWAMAVLGHSLAVWWKYIHTKAEEDFIVAKKLAEQGLEKCTQTAEMMPKRVKDIYAQLNNVLIDEDMCRDKKLWKSVYKEVYPKILS
ncbi:MAG: hypothetical protein AB1485_05250 [Candidatus Thermoplasmatota archaeon]